MSVSFHTEQGSTRLPERESRRRHRLRGQLHPVAFFSFLLMNEDRLTDVKRDGQRRRGTSALNVTTAAAFSFVSKSVKNLKLKLRMMIETVS